MLWAKEKRVWIQRGVNTTTPDKEAWGEWGETRAPAAGRRGPGPQGLGPGPATLTLPRVQKGHERPLFIFSEWAGALKGLVSFRERKPPSKVPVPRPRWPPQHAHKHTLPAAWPTSTLGSHCWCPSFWTQAGWLPALVSLEELSPRSCCQTQEASRKEFIRVWEEGLCLQCWRKAPQSFKPTAPTQLLSFLPISPKITYLHSGFFLKKKTIISLEKWHNFPELQVTVQEPAGLPSRASPPCSQHWLASFSSPSSSHLETREGF